MTVNRKLFHTVVVLLPLLAVAVWLIAQLGWVGTLLSAAAAIAGLVAYRKAGSRSPVEDPSEASSSPLSTSGLPTADETVFLDLSATVHWQAAQAQSYHADLARALVLRHARDVTSKWRPAQYSLAQHDLAARIGRPEVDASGDLEVWATDVRLDLPEAVQQHLAKMDEAHREGLLWEVDALNQSRIRSYLRDDALRTPASAVVWWLARNQESVQRAVELSDVLTKLSQLATGQTEPNGAAEVQLVVDAVQKLDESARRPAAHDLAAALDQAGMSSVAKALRDKYNLPTLRPIVDIAPVPDRGAGSFGIVGEG